jgi:hypothetical protein
MSRILELLEELEEATIYEVNRLEEWLTGQRHHRRFNPVAGRFAGMFFVSQTGEIVMATQIIPLNTPSTAPLVFSDASGATGPGPVGTITASDPSVSVSLSADGQAANVVLSATLPTPATLVWHDPSNVIPDFTVDVSDVASVFTPVAGAFGTFAPGTT